MTLRPLDLLKTALLSATFTAALSLSGLAQAKVLANVDGMEITDEDLNFAMQDLGPTLPKDADEKTRNKYVMDYLVDSKLVARAAEKEKLTETPDYLNRLAYLKQRALMETKMTAVATASATEDGMKKVYDEAASAQKDVMEVHARHILVATEDEAKAALKRVKGGEDFAKVADELSTDKGSKGGDLGFFTKEKMVPEFSKVAFDTAPGSIADPVKSQFGWHIIKVEEKRAKPFPAYEAVKDQVKRYTIQKAQADLVQSLHKDVKIQRFDEPTPADLLKQLAPADAAKPADPAAPAK